MYFSKLSPKEWGRSGKEGKNEKISNRVNFSVNFLTMSKYNEFRKEIKGTWTPDVMSAMVDDMWEEKLELTSAERSKMYQDANALYFKFEKAGYLTSTNVQPFINKFDSVSILRATVAVARKYQKSL